MSRHSEKHQNERLQLIIAEILKDEENKYCADCDAKGPRWASWNLGVLLCIRCAGIHRGLGVHISKVKSLNLDSWEPQQVAMLKAVGNRRARQLYEANLPEFFRRPQTDSLLEQFIRAKYEQKRYVASNFSVPKPDLESVKKDLLRLEQQGKRKTAHSRAINLPLHTSDSSKTQGRTLKSIAQGAGSSASGTADILGLSSSSPKKSGSDSASPNPAVSKRESPLPSDQTAKSGTGGSFSADLLGLSFGEAAPPQPSTSDGVDNTTSSTAVGEEKLSTKESILALYALSKPNLPPQQPPQPPLMGHNGSAEMGGLFGGATTDNQLAPNRSPPVYHQAAARTFNWGNVTTTPTPVAPNNNGHQVPATKASTPSIDFLGGMDLFQSNAGQNTVASQWPGSFTMPAQTSTKSTNHMTTSTTAAAAPAFSQQFQWPSFQRQPQPPSAAAAVNNQQSYLAQIQGQLASMQLRSGTVD